MNKENLLSDANLLLDAIDTKGNCYVIDCGPFDVYEGEYVTLYINKKVICEGKVTYQDDGTIKVTPLECEG